MIQETNTTRSSSRSRLAVFGMACALLACSPAWSDAATDVVRPVAVAEPTPNPSDDPQFQSELAALREQYQQDRQALKARSAQLAPEERLRLHKELLEAHRAALTKLEDDARSRSQGSRERWEKRREQRVERLEEARKDGSARKRRQDERHSP